MSSVNFKTVKSCISFSVKTILFIFCFFIQIKVHADSLDAIRVEPIKEKQKPKQAEPQIMPKAVDMSEKPDSASHEESLLHAIKKSIQPTEPTQDIVILNTESGFIPESIKLKIGESYRLHVVNVNMKEKNVSFLMDAFTQSHNTYFGNQKTFVIEPQVEGVFSFQCPETGVQGKAVVVKPVPEKRKVAAQE